MPKIIKYQAARYLRLSRDDGDKPESDSISTQRCMINDFVSNYSDIEIVDEMVDDGYSGSNFDRPGFTKLIEAIKERKINCIIVKDLSRFSRDYIGSGMYIMNLFPKWGVRLIAINDNYDSLNASSVNDELMFSFKSIVNDLYLRDISVKIRSHLEVKRKSGQYMGAFVAYGYMKDPNDKHKIVIDENVSDNIKKIFSWVTDGMSPYSIAEKLNSLGILSPAEYKKSVGINHNGFDSKGDKANWSAQAVMRIVKNELYKGTLVQGKRTTVSHKVKLIVEKEKKDWATVQGSHPAIVSEELFRIANDILGRDTRASSKRSDCNIFSGMLFCEDCKNTMVRRTSKYKDSQYVYYRCSTHKNTGECSNHNISESDLYDIVLNAINTHIKLIIGLKKAVDMLADNSFMSDNVKKINKLIEEKQEEIKKRKKDLFLTHQSYYGLFDKTPKTKEQLYDFYLKIIKDYPFVIIEDPFNEDDYETTAALTKECGIQIVGDDLFTTNPKRVAYGISKGAANAVLLKVNQVGTISEALEMIQYAYKFGYAVMPSDSRGEGASIADYAVGINAGSIRESAIGDRGNRFLEIEEELGASAKFIGARGLKGERNQLRADEKL